LCGAYLYNLCNIFATFKLQLFNNPLYH